MTETWNGGCQCGDVRYAVDAAAIKTLYCCHCGDCQRQSGSAFGMSLIVETGGFTLLQGTLSAWQTTTDQNTLKRCLFCPRCGVRIRHDNGTDSAIISVKAGTLDDTHRLAPVAHLWTARAQPWLRLPEDAPCFEKEPPDEEEIYRRYRARR